MTTNKLTDDCNKMTDGSKSQENERVELDEAQRNSTAFHAAHIVRLLFDEFLAGE